ncbi:MAG TPA: protocadherin, partial [Pirellulales bacterium]|nr:protocadherin [Pirellulales bacterium]
GPGGNVVTAGRGSAFVNGQFVGGDAWRAVNGAYTHWGCFTPGWYGGYPGAWWPGKWAVATTAWATATWALAGGYCGCTGSGAYYDYGGNVAYDDGSVYFGDQPVATAEQYYDQAGQIADAGNSSQNEDWLPLGVFAVVAEPSQTNADKVVQLAVNKEGVIRGNMQDTLTDKVVPVTGSVDRQSQRVAIKLEGIDNIVVETGLYNLTNDEVPVLVHFSADRQEPRTLIRLQPPEDADQPKS